MLVLVVEDDLSISESLCEYIATLGMECVSKHSMEEGLAALHELKPNILILDLLLQGKIALDIIKEAHRAEHPPCLVICSALNTAEKIAQEYNVDYFLKKPFNLENLDEILIKNNV